MSLTLHYKMRSRAARVASDAVVVDGSGQAVAEVRASFMLTTPAWRWRGADGERFRIEQLEDGGQYRVLDAAGSVLGVLELPDDGPQIVLRAESGEVVAEVAGQQPYETTQTITLTSGETGEVARQRRGIANATGSEAWSLHFRDAELEGAALTLLRAVPIVLNHLHRKARRGETVV